MVLSLRLTLPLQLQFEDQPLSVVRKWKVLAQIIQRRVLNPQHYELAMEQIAGCGQSCCTSTGSIASFWATPGFSACIIEKLGVACQPLVCNINFKNSSPDPTGPSHNRRGLMTTLLSIFLYVLSQQSCFHVSQSDCRSRLSVLVSQQHWLYLSHAGEVRLGHICTLRNLIYSEFFLFFFIGKVATHNKL